jgi:hypothetical protein
MQNPDESATMALQNQELSVLSQQLGEQGTQLAGQISGLQDYTGQIGSQIYNNVSAQGTQTYNTLQAVDTQLGGQLSGIQNSQNASASANQAFYSSLLTNLTNYANALSSQVQAGNTAQQSQLDTVNKQIQQLGAFSGWQFYQLPNRYAPTIPTSLNPPGWT